MLKKINAKDLKDYVGKEIEYSAFVDTIRDKKWVQFVILRDNTGIVQMTIEKSLEENQEMVELISHLPLESVIKVTCKVVENENDYGVRISEKWHEYYDTRGCVGVLMCEVVWKCNSHHPIPQTNVH